MLFFCRSSSEMETRKKRKTEMNVVLFLMAAILAEPCSAYLSPDIGMICLICLNTLGYNGVELAIIPGAGIS
jgi:hypothetical protein